MKHGVGADPCSVPREALLAEMGVAMREDGGTLGVFSPKKVGAGVPRCCSDVARAGRAVAPFGVSVLWEAGGVPLGAGGAAPGTGLTAIPSLCGSLNPASSQQDVPVAFGHQRGHLAARGVDWTPRGWARLGVLKHVGLGAPRKPAPLMGRAWLDAS